MALELQLTTDKAQAALDKIERSLDSLRLSLDRVATGAGGFDQFTQRLGSVKGINPAAVDSIKELGRAASALSGAGNLNTLSNALSKLAALDVSKAALGVKALVSALNSVRVPAGLDAMANAMDRIATSSQRAASGMRAFSAASNFRLPSVQTSAFANNIQQVGQSAQRAASHVSFFGSTASNLKQALTALGIGALGREFGQFISGAYEAQVAYDKFNAITNNTTGPKTAGKSFQFLRAVAKESATDITVLQGSYTKFAQALYSAGATAPEIGRSFLKLNMAFRGFGLSADDSKGALNAVIQMFQKGTIQAEELIGQLSERGVPALSALAKSMGKTEAEVRKLMEAGKLGRVEMVGFIDQLNKMAAGAVAGQLQKVAAQLSLMNNAFTGFKLAFGEGFFGGVIAGFQSLTAAMQTPVVLQFAYAFGQLAGTIGSVLMMALSNAMIALSVVMAPIIQFTTYIYQIGAALAATPIGAWVGDLLTMADGTSIAGAAMYVLVGSLTVAATAWAVWRVAVLAAATAQTLLAIAMAPVAATILGIAAAVLLSVEAYRAMQGESSLLTDAGQRLADVFGAVKTKAVDLAEGLTFTGDAAINAGNGISNVATKATDAAPKVRDLGTAARQTGNIFDELKTKADSAAAAIDKASSAGGSTGNSSSGGTSKWATNSKWGFGDYAEGRPIDDQFWVPDFTTKGVFSRAGGYSTGGGNGQMVKDVPISAYAGAPRFANGGTTSGMSGSLPDGGIPSILHPNEAVVPLDAGGKIPVSQTGGGVNFQPLVSAFSREFSKNNAVLIEINKNTVAARESSNNIGVVFKNEMDRHLVEHQKTASAVTKLVASFTSLSATLSSAAQTSAASAASGTTDITSASGTVSTGSNRGNVNSSEEQNGGLPGSWGATSGRTIGGVRTTSSTGSSSSSDDAYPFVSGKKRSFASGIANTSAISSDPRGFQATLHPGEAVVPLPDGRSVPVRWEGSQLPHRTRQDDAAEDRMARKDSDSATRQGNRFNITVNVTTPDARSFRNSEDQIAQRLVQRIDRATRNIGVASDVDDPTRVPGRSQ